MTDPPRGYARVLVSAPLITSVLTDGVRGPAEPLAPLPKDAILEAVGLADDVVTLTYSSKAWAETLREAKVLDMGYRVHNAK